MRILVISDGFPDAIHPESGRFVASQAVELAKLVDVSVVVPVGMPLPLRARHRLDRRLRGALPIAEEWNGLSVYRPPYVSLPWHLDQFNALPMLLSVWRTIVKCRLNPDVIHAHFAYSAGYVGVWLGRLLRAPTVITVHGYDINIYTRSQDLAAYGPSAATLYSPIVDRMVRYAVTHAAHIVTVSDELHAKVIELGADAGRTRTIRNGVDLERFHPMDQAACRAMLGIPQKEKKMILFVGGLITRKDPVSLIRAFGEVRKTTDAVLVFIGKGPLETQLREDVRRLGLRDDVQFIGAIPHREVPIWMNACDVLALPSLYESFGCVLMEAIACGKPVVTSWVEAIVDFIHDGEEGFLVPPGDVQALADAIMRALYKPWNTGKLVTYARSFSWTDVARKVYAIYEEVLAGSR